MFSVGSLRGNCDGFQLYRVDLVNFGFRRIFAFLENVQFNVQLTEVLTLAE